MSAPIPDFLRRKKRTASVDLRFMVPLIQLIKLLKTMLSGKKTYITAIVGAITAIGAYLTGDISLTEALKVVFEAALGAFIRNGIASANASK